MVYTHFLSRRLIYTSSFYKKCLKPYQKFCCMKTYLQIMIQTHWTATATPPPILCNHLYSAEGFLKKFVQQTAYKMSPYSYGRMFPQMTGKTGPPSSPLQTIQNMNSSSSNIHHCQHDLRGKPFFSPTGHKENRRECYHDSSVVQLYKSTKLNSIVPGEVSAYRPF